jgi:outer membrane protein assembly factor BamB
MNSSLFSRCALWQNRSVMVTLLAVVACHAAHAQTIDWTYTAYTDRHNVPYGIAPDQQGNVYFAGTIEPSGAPTPTWAFFLAKVDNQGLPQWKQQIGLPTEFNAPAYSNCLELAPNGNVLVTGRTTAGTGGFEQAVVMNYNAQGNHVWTWKMGGGHRSYAGNSDVDSLGNVFVTGQNGESTGAYLAKLDAAGSLLWRKDFGLTMGDESFRATHDTQGNIYVAGGTFGALEGSNLGSRDAFLTKFNAVGDLVWTRQFGTADNDVAYGGVSIDPFGNLYVSGGIYGGASEQAFLHKFDEDGNELWARQFSGDVRDMTLDTVGNIYLAGAAQEILRYNSEGALTWTGPIGLGPFAPAGIPQVLDYEAGYLYFGGVKNGGLNGFNASLSRLQIVPEPQSFFLASFLVPIALASRRVRQRLRWRE